MEGVSSSTLKISSTVTGIVDGGGILNMGIAYGRCELSSYLLKHQRFAQVGIHTCTHEPYREAGTYTRNAGLLSLTACKHPGHVQ